MTAYIVLLVVAPLLNILCNQVSRRILGVLAVSLTVVSGLPLLGITAIPFDNVVYGICGYIVGAYLRLCNDPLKVFTFGRTVGFILCFVVFSTVFSYLAMHQSSPQLRELLGWFGQLHAGVRPLQILAATSMFACVANHTGRVPFSNRWINTIASGAFGVYLLHEHYLGWRILWTAVGSIVPKPEGVLFKALAGSVSIVAIYATLTLLSLVIDRFLVNPLQRAIISGVLRTRCFGQNG